MRLYQAKRRGRWGLSTPINGVKSSQVSGKYSIMEWTKEEEEEEYCNSAEQPCVHLQCTYSSSVAKNKTLVIVLAFSIYCAITFENSK